MSKKNIVLYSDHIETDKVNKFDENDESLSKYVPIINKLKEEYDFEYMYFSTLMKYIFICEYSDPKNSDNDVWNIVHVDEATKSEKSDTVTLDNFDEDDNFEQTLEVTKVIKCNFEELLRELVEAIKKQRTNIRELSKNKKQIFT
jgi:hypothetical protein